MQLNMEILRRPIRYDFGREPVERRYDCIIWPDGLKTHRVKTRGEWEHCRLGYRAVSIPIWTSEKMFCGISTADVVVENRAVCCPAIALTGLGRIPAPTVREHQGVRTGFPTFTVFPTIIHIGLLE